MRQWMLLLAVVSVLLAAVGALLAAVGLWDLSPSVRWIVVCVCAGVVSSVVSYVCGVARGRSRPAAQAGALQGLEELGVVGVYWGTEGSDVLAHRLRSAHKTIRVLALSGDALFRNMGEAIEKALEHGCSVTALLATPGSEATRAVDAMEMADGRPQHARPIGEGAEGAPDLMLNCLRLAAAQLKADEQDRLGEVFLGRLNTEYRASVILCDDEWAWWTPELPPERANQRLSFALAGAESPLRKQCDRYFEAVKKRHEPKELCLSGE